MIIKVKMEINTIIELDCTAPKEDWYNASKDSQNDFIRDKIRDHFQYNVDDLFHNDGVKIEVTPEE